MSNAQDRALLFLARRRGVLPDGAGLPRPQPGERIGPLLVRERLLSAPQLAALLRELQATRFTCEGCRRTLSFAQLGEQEELDCPACRRPLQAQSEVSSPLPQRPADSAGTAPAQPWRGITTVSGKPSVLQSLGRFTVLGEVGRGSNGVVYRVRAPGIERDLALKILHDPAADEETIARFRLEAAVASKLRDPGVVAVHEVGEADGVPYYVMDYVAGETLRQRLRNGPLPPAQAARLLRRLARTVDCAHRESVIHRDLKPANVVLDPSSDRPRILDFGLARDRTLAETMTRSGDILGTPYYMAPEQFRGERRMDHRVDIYALGVILYECLTGRRPYEADNAFGLLEMVERGRPLPPGKVVPAISPKLEAICLRAMAPDPAERFQSARELAEALQEHEQAATVSEDLPAPPPARGAPRGVAVAAVAIVAVGAGFALWIASGPTSPEPPSQASGSPTPEQEGDPLADALRLMEEQARAGKRAPFPEVLALLERAGRLEDPQAREAGLLALADFLRRRGALSAAREKLAPLTARVPRAAYAAAALAELAGDDAGARTRYQELERDGRAGPWGRLAAAAAARLEGDGEQAASLAERVLPELPGRPEPRLELARALLVAGRRDAAAAQLERLREEIPDDPEPLLVLAAVRLEDGQPDSAALPLERALDLLDPGAVHPLARGLRIRLALEREPDQALGLLGETEGLERDPVALCLRAAANALSGDPSQGQRDADAARKLDAAVAERTPASLGPKGREALTRLLVPVPPPPETPDPPPGLRARLEAVPARARPWVRYAQHLAAKDGPWAKVEAALDNADQFSPGDAGLRLERARLAVARGAPKAARVALAALHPKTPAEEAERDLLLGDAAWQEGEVRATLLALDRAAAQKEGGPAAFTAKALACLIRREGEEGKAACDEALRLQPEYGPALVVKTLLSLPSPGTTERLLEAWEQRLGQSDRRLPIAVYAAATASGTRNPMGLMMKMQDPEFQATYEKVQTEASLVDFALLIDAVIQLGEAGRAVAQPLQALMGREPGGDRSAYLQLVQGRIALLARNRAGVTRSWRALRQLEPGVRIPVWDRKEFKRTFKAEPETELVDPN